MCHARLLSGIDESRGMEAGGFAFEGQFMKCGATVTETDLRPNLSFPSVPILLECAGPTGFTAGGLLARHRPGGLHLYILWRWDAESGEWSELARAQSATWDWVHTLRPAAVNALREARGDQVRVLPDLRAVAQRIAAALDHELRNFDPADRGSVLGVIYHQLAVRLSALAIGDTVRPG